MRLWFTMSEFSWNEKGFKSMKQQTLSNNSYMDEMLYIMNSTKLFSPDANIDRWGNATDKVKCM